LPSFFSTLQGGAADALPEADVLLKPVLNQPGVEGFMLLNDAGAWTLLAR
jgi:hypothetical protein